FNGWAHSICEIKSNALRLRRDPFSAIKLRPRRVMPLRLLQYFVVRRRLPFIVIRLTIIFAHRIIFELVPHQNTSQIRMPLKPNAVKIEDLTLLKLATAPYRRQRWQAVSVCAIACAHANDYRAVFMGHRIKVINRLEIAGSFLLSRLDNLLFLTIDKLLYLRCFLHDAIEPIDTRDIGTKIQMQRGIDAQESRYCDRVAVINQ